MLCSFTCLTMILSDVTETQPPGLEAAPCTVTGWMCIFSNKVFPAQDLIILAISSSLPESHTVPFLLFPRAQ